MIEIIKETIFYGTLWIGDLVKCPICGVGSNLWPDYLSSRGTGVIQRLTHCDHKAEGYYKIKESI